MNSFLQALQKQNTTRPPVWFMRQAGRYHSHYQELKKKHSFIELCKNPNLATEVTMGPIQEFDFDAAILFSDLLFPLEVMGLGLEYSPGPQLHRHLKKTEDLRTLRGLSEDALKNLSFQKEALLGIREKLSPEKGLIGFVGGPLTLFYYAVEGSHKGDLSSAKQGLTDGRYEGFVEHLLPLLSENMVLQCEGGLDAIAMFDTCAGELTPEEYARHGVPVLNSLLERFRKKKPDIPVIYYSKKTDADHWRALRDLPIQCLGVDWRNPLPEVFEEFGGQWAIQGGFDPNHFFLETQEFESKLRTYFESMLALPSDLRKGWICGLGHGVLPKTPMNHVHLFLKIQKEFFG